MEKKPNKYIAIAYKLYTNANGKSELVEEAPATKPFTFISGFGLTLEDFENAVIDLDKDAEFDFTLSQEQAYGEHVDERVIDLDKSIFSIDGKFDHENIFVDAVVPLQNEDGNRFMGRVLEITDAKVKMDLNHPLAGQELNFKGKVIDNREATNEEIQSFVNAMNGGGCSCGGGCEGGCEGGCGGDSEGCGCGNCK